MKELKLNLKAGTHPVVLNDGELIREMELREMTAAQRDQYLDRLSARVRLDSDGKLGGIKKFDGMQAELITLCLYSEGKPVETKEIQSWPSSTVAELFKAAQELNSLNRDTEAVEAAAKND